MRRPTPRSTSWPRPWPTSRASMATIPRAGCCSSRAATTAATMGPDPTPASGHRPGPPISPCATLAQRLAARPAQVLAQDGDLDHRHKPQHPERHRGPHRLVRLQRQWDRTTAAVHPRWTRVPGLLPRRRPDAVSADANGTQATRHDRLQQEPAESVLEPHRRRFANPAQNRQPLPVRVRWRPPDRLPVDGDGDGIPGYLDPNSTSTNKAFYAYFSSYGGAYDPNDDNFPGDDRYLEHRDGHQRPASRFQVGFPTSATGGPLSSPSRLRPIRTRASLTLVRQRPPAARRSRTWPRRRSRSSRRARTTTTARAGSTRQPPHARLPNDPTNTPSSTDPSYDRKLRAGQPDQLPQRAAPMMRVCRTR